MTTRAKDSAPSAPRTVQRVNVDFPVDLLREIDREVARLGVTRQALLKLWVADALKRTQDRASS